MSRRHLGRDLKTPLPAPEDAFAGTCSTSEPDQIKLIFGLDNHCNSFLNHTRTTVAAAKPFLNGELELACNSRRARISKQFLRKSHQDTFGGRIPLEIFVFLNGGLKLAYNSLGNRTRTLLAAENHCKYVYFWTEGSKYLIIIVYFEPGHFAGWTRVHFWAPPMSS